MITLMAAVGALLSSLGEDEDGQHPARGRGRGRGGGKGRGNAGNTEQKLSLVLVCECLVKSQNVFCGPHANSWCRFMAQAEEQEPAGLKAAGDLMQPGGEKDLGEATSA